MHSRRRRSRDAAVDLRNRLTHQANTVAARNGRQNAYTTVLWRAMQVRSTSSIGLSHQSLEKISTSEKPE